MASANDEHEEVTVENQPDAEDAAAGDDLAALLTSALNDFSKQPEQQKDDRTKKQPDIQTGSGTGKKKKGKKVDKKEAEHVDPAMIQGVDDMFRNMMSQDPVLKEHWDKLAESCQQAGLLILSLCFSSYSNNFFIAANMASSEDFEKTFEETLRNMSKNMESLPNPSEIPEEEMAKMWSKLGLGVSPDQAANGSIPDIMPLVTNMMQNLLSKEILYPALKDLTDKYPVWLEENSASLQPEDVQRYEKQLMLMREVCEQFECESPDDTDSVKKERFNTILTTMQKMQECGSPPKDLVGDVPEMGSPDGDFSKLPGFNPSNSQCCLQ